MSRSAPRRSSSRGAVDEMTDLRRVDGKLDVLRRDVFEQVSQVYFLEVTTSSTVRGC